MPSIPREKREDLVMWEGGGGGVWKTPRLLALPADVRWSAETGSAGGRAGLGVRQESFLDMLSLRFLETDTLKDGQGQIKKVI